MPHAEPPLDYDRAVALLPGKRDRLVAGDCMVPTWSTDSRSFWLCIESAEGKEYVRVDADTGEKTPVFDADAVAEALAGFSGEAINGRQLNATELDLVGMRGRFRVGHALHRVDLGHQPTVVESATSYSWELVSPNGEWALYVEDSNLWVRSLVDGLARPLTTEGSPECPIGLSPDPGQRRSRHRALGTRPHPSATWSEDSRRVLTVQSDQRDVRLATLTRSRPSEDEAPEYEEYRYPLPGDEVIATASVLSIDVATAEVTRAECAPMVVGPFSLADRGELWWLDNRYAAFIERDRYFTSVAVREFDSETGTVRTVMEERGTSRRVELNPFEHQPPLVSLQREQDRIVWYSERDGWGHLYLHRYSDGQLLRRLTSGDWRVNRIAGVVGDTLLIEVTGRRSEDPYLKHLLSVDLIDALVEELVVDEFDHEFSVSPDCRHVVDRVSRVDTPPRTILRHLGTDRAVLIHECSDAELRRLGWRPRIRVEVVAADGRTHLFGNLTLPFDLDPHRRYPLIDQIYPGPQVLQSSPGWEEYLDWDIDALASLGFAVLTLNARGTPGRSRDFHHAALGNHGNAGFLEDHVAAVQQLSERFEWIDLDRIGIKGASGGGYAAARAILDYPDTYKVAVSLCGAHDERFYQPHWTEGYQGRDDGRSWQELSNPRRVESLRGRLFLAHGEMDDNVHVTQTLRLVNALVAANKDFELLILPGAEHNFIGSAGYVLRRSWDFLVRELLGGRPPQQYLIDERLFPNGLERPT